MWDAKYAKGYESRKCRWRVAQFCRGLGLDVSDSEEKITPKSVSVGMKHTHCSLPIDQSSPSGLSLLGSSAFDFVFDGHSLGNYRSTEFILEQWWRLVKPGGHLILYEQDPEYYPLVGTPGASEERKQDVSWEKAWDILASFGNATKLYANRHNTSNEYAWEMVVRKEFTALDKPREYMNEGDYKGMIGINRRKKTNKEALVVRLGALGDAIWVTPVFKALKKDGYYTVCMCNEYSAQVFKECKWIDEFIIWRDGKDVPYFELEQAWECWYKGFERVINLSKSVEGSLLACEGGDEFFWPHEKRHAAYNFNYIDRTMELAGYPDLKGEQPEFHVTEYEDFLARNFFSQHEDQFVVIWALAGSAFHKVYPWAEYVANEFLAPREDARIYTVGDEQCRILEWNNPRTINKAAVWTVRQSFLATKYANLVIGPDTGVLNAASCFDTPKIVFMSAGSEENLTKYWRNAVPLHAEGCECHPCHKLIYTNTCPRGSVQGVAPKCMEDIKPEDVLREMVKAYDQWKSGKIIKQNTLKWCAITLADTPLTHHLAERVFTSFRKFHPEIPCMIYNPNDEQRIFGDISPVDSASPSFGFRPRIINKLMSDYDGVIYLDADTVVCGRLDEMLAGDFDVAVSLNIGAEEYYNAGVCAIRSPSFANAWYHEMIKPGAGQSNQVHFNNLVASGQWRRKVLDREHVFYNERSREHWGKIKIFNDQLVCMGRVIKVLHWAGGVGKMENKISSADFSPEVRVWLDKTTDTIDFTTVQGEEVSKW